MDERSSVGEQERTESFVPLAERFFLFPSHHLPFFPIPTRNPAPLFYYVEYALPATRPLAGYETKKSVNWNLTLRNRFGCWG